MIIKDKADNRYQLLKKELRSIDNPKYIVKFYDINENGDGQSAQIFTRNFNGQEWAGYMRVRITETAIGCRVFTKTTMRKIKAAIKAAGKKAKR